VLANYLLYFENYQKNKSKDQNNPSNDCIQTVLAKMLMLENDKIDYMALYPTVHEKYGQNMVEVVQKCMEPQFNSSEIATMVASIKESQNHESFVATITDVCADETLKFEKNSENLATDALIDSSFRNNAKVK
jgi:hypothetical protein